MGSGLVDLYPKQHYRSVRPELTGDNSGGNEATGSDQISVIAPVRVQRRKFVKPFGESISDRRQVDEQKVRRRRLTVRTTRLTKLAVQFGEEL